MVIDYSLSYMSLTWHTENYQKITR